MTQAVKKAAVRLGYIALGLAIAITAGLASRGAVAANSCDIPHGTPSGTISYEDRQEILDLISNFSWVFDMPEVSPEDRQKQLNRMFATPFTFVVCSRANVIFGPTVDHSELFAQIDDIYKTLKQDGTKSSHLITNTVLTRRDDGTVEEESLMVLVLQESGAEDHPKIDYSAIVRGIIQKDPNTNHWQFKKRTLDIGATTASYAR